jgi:hypothetical protein
MLGSHAQCLNRSSRRHEKIDAGETALFPAPQDNGMRLLKDLSVRLGFTQPSSATAPGDAYEEAVIVHFDCPQPDWSAFLDFERELEHAICAADIGEYDGNELATHGRDGSFYMYGPDADALFAIVRPRLLAASFLSNVVVTLRYGPVTDPGAREAVVRLRP